MKRFDAAGVQGVPGVRYVVEVPERRRRRRHQLLGREEGPRRAEGRVGRDDGAQGLVGRPPGRVPQARRHAGHRRPQRRRRGEGAGGRGEEARGVVRFPVPRARRDGAAGLRGQARRRPLRGLERRAVPDRRPARRRQDGRPAAGEGHAQHALRRRQLRPPRESRRRLRRRGARRSRRRCRCRASPACRSSSCGRARTT